MIKIFLCLIIFSLFIFQNRIIYSCGNTPQLLSPVSFGLPIPEYSALTHFKRDNTELAIYYFHGNGINAENTWWHVGRLYSICNCSIFVVETINCISPSFFGNSIASTLYWLEKSIYPTLGRYKHNILFGVSLGTAHVSNIYHRHEKHISGIILENPFTSIDELTYIPNFMIFNNWDNRHFSTTIPLLILTSEKDEIVPPSMSKDLCQQNNCTHVILPGALHGHAGAHPYHLPAISNFLLKKI